MRWLILTGVTAVGLGTTLFVEARRGKGSVSPMTTTAETVGGIVLVAAGLLSAGYAASKCAAPPSQQVTKTQ